MNNLPNPETKDEKYLYNIAGGEGVDIPDNPVTKSEIYLKKIAENSGSESVTSVNGKTGDVVLDANDILVDNSQTVQQNLERIDEEVEDIIDLIPAQADVNNKLADKNFVNSSIATNTANYIYKTVDSEKVPFDSVAELEAYAGVVTNNDYAFVTGVDSAGNRYYDRYKAVVVGDVVTWAKEYRLNNSSFTAEQWASIQSGITSALVGRMLLTPLTTPIEKVLIGVDESNAEVQFKSGVGLSIGGSTSPYGLNVVGISYVTTAPTSANTDGIKIVILDEEPATKYNGYLYFIKESA